MADIGTKIALVGLILQLLSFLVFCALMVSFGLRAQKSRMALGRQAGVALVSPFRKTKGEEETASWTWTFVVLCISSIGIIVRCVYRTIEFTQG